MRRGGRRGPHSRPFLACLLAAVGLLLPRVDASAAAALPTRTLALQPVPAGQFVIEGDQIAFVAATNTITATGHVRVTHPGFRLFADVASYEVRTQTLTAEGNVRLIDDQGREVRGGRIVYVVPSQQGIIFRAQMILGGTYVSGERVEISPAQIVAEQAMATICDPRNPLFRVTAQRIDVIPGDVAVAHNASLWLGGVRLLTLRTYRLSLRPAQAPRGPVVRLGYDRETGAFVAYTHRYAFGAAAGVFDAKFGTRTRLSVSNTITYDQPDWRVTLRGARTQYERADGQIDGPLTLGELRAAKTPVPLGRSPVRWSIDLGAGWFDDVPAHAATTRLDAGMMFTTGALRLGSGLTFTAEAGYRSFWYGTGQQQQVLATRASLTQRLGPMSTLTLTHELVAPSGATPFLFDLPEAKNLVGAAWARATQDWRLGASVSHDFAVPETLLGGEVAVRIAPRIFVGVSASYNATTAAFEDLDYSIEFLCDCLNAKVTWRQMRHEVMLQFSLTPSPRVGFLPPPAP